MKKLFTLAAAVLFAMGMSAQTIYEQEVICNYINFQNDGDHNTVITSTTPQTLANGSILKGCLKTKDGVQSEADCKWNAKSKYDTSVPLPESFTDGVMDTLVVGTAWRAAAGCSLELGAFVCTGGKLRIAWQPNADSERGFQVTIKGGDPISFQKTGEKLPAGSKEIRKGYISEIDLPAGQYLAGDVVLTVLVNTSNFFGIGIEGLYTGIQETMAEAGVRYNGIEIINENRRDISVFNTLGQMVARTNDNFNMSEMPAGVYMVRVAGVKGALKIQK
ncbi:MAG TPA: hypothetical protein DEO38_05310 [Bacteroidales bacterium]|nr:hypothetical protein [Bacteroidales bacterium]